MPQKKSRRWNPIDKKSPDERRASDPEAIAYDKCARAIVTMKRRIGSWDENQRAAGRIVSMLMDRFDAKLPATFLRKKVEE